METRTRYVREDARTVYPALPLPWLYIVIITKVNMELAKSAPRTKKHGKKR
jgi:hypothetical protein